MTNKNLLEYFLLEIVISLKKLFKSEDRFMSHITIARVKSVKDKKRFLEELKNIKLKKINFVIDKFSLMESVLMPEEPEYKIIEEYTLK